MYVPAIIGQFEHSTVLLLKKMCTFDGKTWPSFNLFNITFKLYQKGYILISLNPLSTGDPLLKG